MINERENNYVIAFHSSLCIRYLASLLYNTDGQTAELTD